LDGVPSARASYSVNIKRPASTFSNLAKIGTRYPTTAVRREIPDARAVAVVAIELVQRRAAAR
jgi:hypothetical protein